MTDRERTGGQLFKLTGEKITKERGYPGQSGFTLVEMIITLALAILFLAGVVGLVAQGFTFLGTHQNLATLNRDGNNALDRLETLIHGCSNIEDDFTFVNLFTYTADIDADGYGDRILINNSWDKKDLRVTVDGVISIVLSGLDTDAANPLEFTYYSEWKHEPGDEVTSNYNKSVKVVKITVHLTKTTSGETMKRTYKRYVLLKLGPDDRAA